MSEEVITIEEFTRKCPVEVGDYFYRKKPNMTLPDRLQVLEVKDMGTMYAIRAKYIYHALGPGQERTFSDIIFRDLDWIIEKKGAR